MSGNETWWSALRHGGLLISPSRLSTLRPSPPAPIHPQLGDRLRADVTRLATGTPESRRELLDTVFELVCGLRSVDGHQWLKGNDVGGEWSRRAATGETLKPRRVWVPAQGTPLPVFTDNEPRIGLGRGRRSVSRVLEWLRASGSRIAILTNHRQFRLMYAGPDYDAWAEWDTALWFQEGGAGPQVDALRWLLTPETLAATKEGGRGSLLEAIEESRKGQAELSSALGERVRQAVESLIQAYGDQFAELAPAVSPRDIYIAATRVVMRMVVVLFAEARELLPRDNPQYEESYGLQGLRTSLERITGAARTRRQFRYAAWPRILGLFRLVYEGSHHPQVLIRRYGGGLFAAGNARSADPIERALSVLEDPAHGPHDETVSRMLDLLCRTEMRVRVGHALKPVPVPVDFSDLSSEYIGILYEGLLDYELRRAPADDPFVFLNLGDQPVLPLSRLLDMDDATVKGLVEKLKVKRASVSAGEDGDEEESAEDADDQPDAEDVDSVDQADAEPVLQEVAEAESDDEFEEEEPAEADHVLVNELRAHEWAVRAVKAGGLVPKPRGRGADALAAYEEHVAAAAKQLVFRVVQPGEWFLVLWGGTRKGSGTFYTRPQLAVPTVHRTLRELAYDAPALGDEAPLAEWIPKTPETILGLKVCDPAIGSGSFAVAALRFLTEALWRSVLHHRWLVEEDDRFVVQARGTEPPPWFAESVRDLPVTSGDAESHVRARLRRVVVERCIYGVDLDPLAIELARLSIWVETMDRTLPFEFLDHRIKVGNALVGCWFDRFRDYPLMAWMREGGDKNHTNFVHHFREKRTRAGAKAARSGDKWTAEIKEWRDKRIKPDLVSWVIGQGSILESIEGRAPEVVHDEAVALLSRMEQIPVQEPEERAEFYRRELLENSAFQRLCSAFDTWCALWFWPPEALATAPVASRFGAPDEAASRVIADLRARLRFFHWELEFPDVFVGPQSGFDALVGNPPWEIQKPNSKEFFSDIDPLYRGYGKQEAIRKQKEYFEREPEIERNWVSYAAHYKALSNWNKFAATPFGDPDEGEAFSLEGGDEDKVHRRWRAKRANRTCYVDPRHPFKNQGSADINTYKMFLEQAHGLLKPAGKLGIIVPSGVYTDKGSSALRALFLEHCRWEWLFGFENRDQIFDIHRSFKFCPIIVSKGGRTEAVRAAFMRHDLRDWEEGERHVFRYTQALIRRFSPLRSAFQEIEQQRDVDILETLYANGLPLGSQTENAWQVRCSRELHMRDDSAAFRSASQLEKEGWTASPEAIWTQDGERALPLIQGTMVDHFSNWDKNWLHGNGVRARWKENVPGTATTRPQYLVNQSYWANSPKIERTLKIVYSRIRRTTDARTWMGTVVYGWPTGDSLFMLYGGRLLTAEAFSLAAYLNSFVYDWQLRRRMGGTNVSWAFLEETAVPHIGRIGLQELGNLCVRLSGHSDADAVLWQYALAENPHLRRMPWDRLRAVTKYERLRLRIIVDVIAAFVAGISYDQLAWILRDCDHPKERLADKRFRATLDPKGFWRVDQDRDPEARQTVLTLVAYDELRKRIAAKGVGLKTAIQDFSGAADGDGWDCPDAVRLADYQLGRDSRSKGFQPVAAQFGPRHEDWQLRRTADESWEECERHTRTLLGADGFEQLKIQIAAAGEAEALSRKFGTAEAADGSLARNSAGPLFDHRTDDSV
jgi:hypothetical protein